MRRFLFGGFAAFAGGIFAAHLGRGPALLALFLLPLLAAVLEGKPSFRTMGWMFLFWMAGGGLILWEDRGPDPVEQLWGQETLLTGRVVSASEGQDQTALVIRLSSGGKVMLNLYASPGEGYETVGRGIAFRGIMEAPPAAGNPRGFDYRLYLRSVGITGRMAGDWAGAVFSDVKNPVAHGLAAFRQGFARALSQRLGEARAGLAAALLFGDKGGLEEEAYEAFQRNGTAHVLAVSGLHMAVLYGFLSRILRAHRKRGANLLLLGVLLLYGFLTGFSPSVSRGLLMIGLHAGARILCRPYDLLTATGASGLIILAVNPWQLFHPGFQLSFLAVIALGVLFPLLGKAAGHRKVLAVLLPMAALQAALVPVTAWMFNYVSFGAFVANYGVVFLSGLLVPAGFLAMTAYLLSAPLFDYSAAFLCVGLDLMTWVNGAVYQDGRFSPDVTGPPETLLGLFYGFGFLLLSETGRIWMMRRRFRPLASCMACILAASILAGAMTVPAGFERAEAVFVDVGQGDCLHLRTGDGKDLLIDGGGKEGFDVGKKILRPYLLKNGVRRVELALATHLDLDHFDGLRSLAASGMVGKLALYEGNRLLQAEILKQTGLHAEDLLYLKAGDVLEFSGVRLEILFPAGKVDAAYQKEIEGRDENPRSLVVRVVWPQGKLLMTGDLDFETEERMLDLLERSGGAPEADILKIPHHGSPSGTGGALLEAVRPSVAVIPVGRNNYGHPSEAVLVKCRQRGIMVFRTDRQGAIAIAGLSRGRSLQVFCMKEP